ncbi:hypothetical protein TUM20983_37030 [Mycobacterium antarcticum]|nr:hypothetical protein TUM20983_37030 [Mycolicibacterium sp. TUM20983]
MSPIAEAPRDPSAIAVKRLPGARCEPCESRIDADYRGAERDRQRGHAEQGADGCRQRGEIQCSNEGGDSQGREGGEATNARRHACTAGAPTSIARGDGERGSHRRCQCDRHVPWHLRSYLLADTTVDERTVGKHHQSGLMTAAQVNDGIGDSAVLWCR